MTAVCLLFLAGCTAQHTNQPSGGEPLTPEEQMSLYEERVQSDGEPDIIAKGTLYWTPNGTKYHKDPNCSYLKNAKEVLSGTALQAANHGVSEPCSRCAGG